MKKYLMLSLILILAISLFSCTQKESSESSQTSEPVAETTDQDEEVTIEVSPPEGWELNKDSVLPVHYMKNTASFMTKVEPFTSDTLDGVVDEALGIYKDTFDNLAVQGDVETITVDGKEAKKLLFTCTVSGADMKYLYVYLFVEGDVYVITFGDLADSFDSLSDDYTTILKDIKFKSM